MSLPRDGLHPVPIETARVAHAAFPEGNVYLGLRDALGTLFDDALFSAVYSGEGQPALDPWQVALVSVLQFMENLSDRQAVHGVHGRIDWKYALGLELTDEGFHYSVPSRVPLAPGTGQSRTGPVGHVAPALSRTRLAQSANASGLLRRMYFDACTSTHVLRRMYWAPSRP